MIRSGKFFGIGVGPGEAGLIPVAAWNTLKKCEVIFVPRAKTMDHSVARGCLPTDEIPDHRFREIEFAMETDRGVLSEHYRKLAEIIGVELNAGCDVAYLTFRGSFDLFDLHLHTGSAAGSNSRSAIPDLSWGAKLLCGRRGRRVCAWRR